MNLALKLDLYLFHWLFRKGSGRACYLARYASKTGDGPFYLLVGIVLYLIEPQYGPLFFYTALLAYALELPVYVLLKKTFQRKRPCDVLLDFNAHVSPSDKFSLPSGHTAAAFLMATVLADFYPVVVPLVFVWASIIGVSRVLLGVHYPSDVLAGALLGTLMAHLALFMLV